MELLGLTGPLLIGVAIAAVASLAFYLAFAAGQFNVSQAGFMAIGAYAVAMATTGGQPALLGIAVGMAISVVVGAALTAMTRKLSGVYLAMATLAFVQVVEQAIYVSPALSGPQGIYGIPLSMNAMQSWAILLAVAVVIQRTMRARIGYEMRILREDPIVARGIGINESRVRLFSGIASALVASLAGGMRALTTSYISPDEFSFGLLIQIMSFAVVGGTDRFWGPILGAVGLTLLPEYTRGLQEYRMVFTGVIILLVIVLFPEGIAGGFLRLRQRVAARRARTGATAAGGDMPATGAVWKPATAESPTGKRLVCEARELAKRFGGVAAVDGVSVQLRSGIVHGLIGPNGAGKSTLVDLLSGEQRPIHGKVYLEEADVTPLGAHGRARLGIARTFQTSRLTQNMTTREVVYSSCLMASRPGSLGYIAGTPTSRREYVQARRQADQIVARVGLHTAAGRSVRDLGWEEQRRLEVARAVALRPKVLLLDEPTAGMHMQSLPAFGAIVRGLAADGTAVLLIEHNVAFIRSTVDTLYAMDSGRLVAHGSPDAVLADRAVVDSYLGATGR